MDNCAKRNLTISFLYDRYADYSSDKLVRNALAAFRDQIDLEITSLCPYPCEDPDDTAAVSEQTELAAALAAVIPASDVRSFTDRCPELVACLTKGAYDRFSAEVSDRLRFLWTVVLDSALESERSDPSDLYRHIQALPDGLKSKLALLRGSGIVPGDTCRSGEKQIYFLSPEELPQSGVIIRIDAGKADAVERFISALTDINNLIREKMLTRRPVEDIPYHAYCHRDHSVFELKHLTDAQIANLNQRVLD